MRIHLLGIQVRLDVPFKSCNPLVSVETIATFGGNPKLKWLGHPSCGSECTPGASHLASPAVATGLRLSTGASKPAPPRKPLRALPAAHGAVAPSTRKHKVHLPGPCLPMCPKRGNNKNSMKQNNSNKASPYPGRLVAFAAAAESLPSMIARSYVDCYVIDERVAGNLATLATNQDMADLSMQHSKETLRQIDWNKHEFEILASC